MFFLLPIEREVYLEPSMFGKGMEDQLKIKVQNEFVGRVLESVGFCMCITNWTSISKGKICDGGSAKFTVAFQALLCCPFTGQVIDATVTSVDQIGAQCVAGPVSLFISSKAMPEFSFSPELSCWSKTENPSETIAAHTKLRLKVTSVGLFQKSVRCTGTLVGDYLGITQQ